MGQPDYLDLDSAAVTSAGNHTAGTSADWATWASRSETLLRGTAGGARQGKVTSAFETYLARWNPTLRTLPTRAETLGGNAAAAASTVDGADTDSSSLLAQQAGAGQHQGSYLSRPINTPQ